MSKLKIAAFFLACTFSATPAHGQPVAQAQSDDAERVFARAVKLHESGDIEGAIREYKTVLSLRADRIDARSNLGAAYARLGRYEEAIEQYKRALAIDGLNTTIRFNLALTFYKAAYITEAVAELTRVVASQPGNKTSILLLADCHLQLGEYSKVIELLSPLDATFGTDRVFSFILGTALISDKQIEKGQLLIDRIFRQGDSAEVRVMMGAAHMMTGDYQSALKELERALEMNPGLRTLNALYGRALLPVGETERAEKAFRRELEINPNDFESNLYLGILLKKEDKNQEALGYLEKAAQVRPNDLNARYYIAAIHLATGKAAEALRLLEGIAGAAPDFVEAHVLLATAYYRLNRKADGDREREVVKKLQAEQQKHQADRPDRGDAYGGTKLSTPEVTRRRP